MARHEEKWSGEAAERMYSVAESSGEGVPACLQKLAGHGGQRPQRLQVRQSYASQVRRRHRDVLNSLSLDFSLWPTVNTKMREKESKWPPNKERCEPTCRVFGEKATSTASWAPWLVPAAGGSHFPEGSLPESKLMRVAALARQFSLARRNSWLGVCSTPHEFDVQSCAYVPCLSGARRPSFHSHFHGHVHSRFQQTLIQQSWLSCLK